MQNCAWRKAMLKGKTLQEIRDLSDAELAVLFETTDTKRAAAARGLMQKAFENVDLQEYLDGKGGTYVFETGRGYLDAGVRDQLDDSVRVDSTIAGFWAGSVAQSMNEMFSVEGVAMNLLPFAQLSGKLGLVSASGKAIFSGSLWKASAQAEQVSALGATLSAVQKVVPGMEGAGIGIHEAFAASRFGNSVGTFAAQHPNSLIALGALEGTVIGIGGTMLVDYYFPGSGFI